MSKTFVGALICLLIFAAIVCSGNAQDPASPISQMVNALKKQQTELTDNQNKLDEKIADLAESVRVARLYMSRAGGKHKPPPPPKP